MLFWHKALGTCLVLDPYAGPELKLHIKRSTEGEPFIIEQKMNLRDFGVAAPNVICLVPDVMVGMGFTREEVRESLVSQKYNEVTATYLLLGRKNEVSVSAFVLDFFADLFI